MKSINERARDYFKSNPGTAELFGTSDGTLFLVKQYAHAHATTLEDREIENFTEGQYSPVDLEEENADTDADLAAKKTAVAAKAAPEKANKTAAKVVAPKPAPAKADKTAAKDVAPKPAKGPVTKGVTQDPEQDISPATDNKVANNQEPEDKNSEVEKKENATD